MIYKKIILISNQKANECFHYFKVMPGVKVEDMGHKMGLNGVDNAKLSFNQVRVPRENLLNRYSDVSPEGKFR